MSTPITRSKTSSSIDKTSTTSSRLSIAERIQKTETLLKSFCSHIIYIPNVNATLNHQLFALIKKGYSLNTLAKSLVICQISLRSLLITNTPLSEKEMTLLTSSCEDISSSGSSGIQLRNTTSQTEQEKSSLPSTSILPLTALPIKKRPLQEKTTDEEQKVKRAKLSSPTPSRSKEETLPVSQTSESCVASLISSNSSDAIWNASSIRFLLKNVAKRTLIERTSRLLPCESVACSTPHNVCSTCQLTLMVDLKLKKTAIIQLEKLLQFTSLEALEAALLKNSFSKSAILTSDLGFSNLNLAFLIKDCNIGDAICIDRGSNPGKLLNLYLEMLQVVHLGTTTPLVKLMKQIWDNSPPIELTVPTFEANILMIESSGIVIRITQSYLEELIADAERLLRYSSTTSHRTSSYRRKMSADFQQTSSLLAMYTLMAMIHHQEGKKYCIETPQGLAVPQTIVKHVFYAVLASNTTCSILISLSKPSMQPMKGITFPADEAKILSESLLAFSRRNLINAPRLGKLSGFASLTSFYLGN
ncbi:hypothetical protein CP10139811_0747 [Chlamydia ibidis]|uniref:Uncharacterized protein n=2 Tax=Chlamydia ibidis TaxID=1405396 RepID=S7J372_9CHLA|nr:hypothetical protein [Chlamydia ibidis]EPP34849.1 hypothetical protein CP10139811_0747 [Chlamydia ibidis]EQM63096.1 hypothetical protein H359_0067 [Chlamydia ibidis 10-1398/6]